MRSFFLSSLFVLLGSSFLFVKDRMPSCYLMSDSLNKKMTKTESKFRFNVLNVTEDLRISVNGIWKTVKLDAQNNFELKVQPGTYDFEFLLNEDYYEIFLSKITIEAQHVQDYRMFFEGSEREQIKLKKPVVYFHSAVEREVKVAVVPIHKFVFTYPEATSGIWNGIVKPDSGIEIDGVEYPYLFWESEQKYAFKSEGNGFKVDKADVVLFLTKKLEELGFTQQEKTDFITFWGPALAENECSFVQFSIDESCNKFATMECSPTPDFTRRVYIHIAKWDPQFQTYLNEVSFQSIPKSDWYVLEWGGFSFELPNIGLIEE
jgi:hypothetical protein